MERRVIIAVVLSFLVLFGYQALVVKPNAKRPAPAAAAQGSPAETPPVEAAPAPQAPVGPQPAVLAGETAERRIVIETSRVKATFSNRGALLESWLLKDYLDSKGRPMDMVAPALTTPERHPLALTVGDAALSARVNTALYQASTGDQHLDTRTGSIQFTYRDASGVSVVKTIEIQPDGQPFLLRVNTEVLLNGQRQRVTVHGGAGFGDIERGVKSTSWLAPSTYQPPQAIVHMVGVKDPARIPVANLAAQPVHEGLERYGGVDDQYFLAAALTNGKHTRIEYAPLTVKTDDGERHIIDYRVRVAGDAPLTFFIGPKEFDLLQRADVELTRTINLGIFGFLATPLLKALKWVNEYVGNFGWSIILLTILINIVMFPLRHKSAVSMRKMQQIQPQVKAIQDRYAKLKMTDPARQKMNQELMELYKAKGANPASGCVPMFLTFPVLFAFYAFLSQAIELRGAPWILWIHDLSRHDPYYVTPVLMGASQFLQTRMMPPTGDPAQQRMMMFMPLMFMVFFLWAPSGLVLYWLCSNLWTIGQQYFTNRLLANGQLAKAR
ncbi:MAG: membrane protein insertase YidC [Vicinamibacteraceae bacterium]